jgi:hypothetical protein
MYWFCNNEDGMIINLSKQIYYPYVISMFNQYITDCSEDSKYSYATITSDEGEEVITFYKFQKLMKNLILG